MVRRWVFWLVTVFILSGCASTTTAPVQDRSTPRVTSLVANDYIVRRGDTLYSIAFRYGLNVKTVAQLNHIGPPYTIIPGQRLIVQREGIVRVEEVGGGAPVVQLTAASPVSSQTKSSLQPASKTTTNPSSANKSVPAAAVSDASVSRVNKSKTRLPSTKSKSPSRTSTAVSKPVVTAKKTPVSKKTTSKPSSSTGKSKQNTSKTNVASAASSARLVWRWPHNGTVVRNFSTKNSGNKGLNIRGRLGDPVTAAAAGTVVYAGANLRGYGNLIIVNHNEKFLSAYGHNRKILVKEGDKVKAGAQIAEMGNSGADAIMLHFEIRINGVPVDPTAYLPKR